MAAISQIFLYALSWLKNHSALYETYKQNWLTHYTTKNLMATNHKVWNTLLSYLSWECKSHPRNFHGKKNQSGIVEEDPRTERSMRCLIADTLVNRHAIRKLCIRWIKIINFDNQKQNNEPPRTSPTDGYGEQQFWGQCPEYICYYIQVRSMH